MYFSRGLIMKLFILLIFTSITFGVFAGTSTTTAWKPGKSHRCGFNKFRCPKAGNKCIRKPKKKKCEAVKIRGRGKKAQVKYVDWCKRKGYTCTGSYSSCLHNGMTYSQSYEVNPYAACAP